MGRVEASASGALGQRQNMLGSQQACLVVFDDGQKEAVHPLCDERTTFIGRSRGVEIRLEDPAVSNFHAAVFRHGGSWCVRDLDSTNGTSVNGKPVRHHVLAPNDRIEIAGVASLFFTDRGFRAVADPHAPALESVAQVPQPTDLEGLLRELSEIYAGWAKEAGRRVELVLPASLPEVRLDRTATTRVLDSFVRSALRRSPRGGCVRVAARVVEERVEITIAGEVPLFEPTETERMLSLLEREMPGVVQRLVALQGGTVRGSAPPGGAARFALSFPLDGGGKRPPR